MGVKIPPPKVVGRIKLGEVIGGALQMSHIVKDLSGVPLEKQRIMAPSAPYFVLKHAGKVRRGLNSFIALKPSPLGLCGYIC